MLMASSLEHLLQRQNVMAQDLFLGPVGAAQAGHCRVASPQLITNAATCSQLSG